jgi:UPF0176 protein
MLYGMAERFEIATFYRFLPLGETEKLNELRARLRELMQEFGIKGTTILAHEGVNATVCGVPQNLRSFIERLGRLFSVEITYRSTFHRYVPFRRADVKIKKEIVSLRREVKLEAGEGTHVEPAKWNELIRDPNVVILDSRNDYEYRTGTFRGSLNPGTEKFSDLPDYIEQNLDPAKDKKLAVFCTGGIRCEKLVPLLVERGFTNVYQLRGGILGYLEAIPEEDSMWEGECFVFDDRVSLDHGLRKGHGPDLSQPRAEETAQHGLRAI